MDSIKGHFDGMGIVLDEPPPATLVVGQAVRVVVEPPAPNDMPLPPRPSLVGFAKGTFAEPPDILIKGNDWDERTALHVDPADRVPPDFVRRPGSAAGEIGIADDFDATPEDFKDYL